MAATGCRISEALALTRRNIDFEAKHVIIECLKKRGRQVFRAIPLQSDLLVHLKGLIDGSAASGGRLWPWSRMTGYRRICEIMSEAGISGGHATPKGLRHGFGVYAIQSKVPLNLVQRWLGHADIKTTAIYTSAMGPEEREIAARMWDESPAETGAAPRRSRSHAKKASRCTEGNETHCCSCSHSASCAGAGNILKKSDNPMDILNDFTDLLEIDRKGRTDLEPSCHLIQFWLNCLRRYACIPSTFSDFIDRRATPLILPWHKTPTSP